MSISYYECVHVALVIEHGKRRRHIVTCGLSGPNIFFQITSLTSIFVEKFIELRCVEIFYVTLV
jgi:hypothetical protein